MDKAMVFLLVPHFVPMVAPCQVNVRTPGNVVVDYFGRADAVPYRSLAAQRHEYPQTRKFFAGAYDRYMAQRP
jgi:hypothetical protein